MTKPNPTGNTRQIYASIREDLYLATKARATEMRMPLRQFIEMALELALTGQERSAPHPAARPAPPTIWEDEYLRMQAQQPVGSPVELTREEAEKVVRASFGPGPADSSSDGRKGTSDG